MKTAIQLCAQELLETDLPLLSKMKVIEILHNNLEKEKQQIIDFANKCRMVNEINSNGDVNFIFTPELLFEQTFNTSKRI